MSDYLLHEKSFTIKNYNQKRSFASFLPGIAGPLGIPIWAFYVNRSQAIAGFGIRDKNQPIMPFTPANKAYESIASSGFRTFIKHQNGVYEPFHISTPFNHQITIKQSSVTLYEENTDLGLSTEVSYFGLPQEALPGLVRRVTFTNTSSVPQELEILDGIAEILPAGIQNDVFKSLSNIMASWITVERLDEHVGYFKLRSSTSDSSEVKLMNEGHFYIGIHDSKRIKPIVDPGLVFAYDTSKQSPFHFSNETLKTITSTKQVTSNQIPCAFIPLQQSLAPGQSTTLYSVAGYATDFAQLEGFMSMFSDTSYWHTKEQEAQTVIDLLTEEITTKTAKPMFDAYVEQCYLDNILRGGYPVQLGQHTYHLYSRRHGDLERDYNFFSLAPEYYSQGSGNFRDVCQNRRLDSVFHPEVERSNLHQFLSLIQLDGYNPLSVGGHLFRVIDKEAVSQALTYHDVSDLALIELLDEMFTPGQLMAKLQTLLPFQPEEAYDLFELVINHSSKELQAQFGEGYWSDHFTYVMDLIDSYKAMYPDRLEDLLYEDESYMYFDSPVSVKPLAEKITQNDSGQLRQYHGLRHPDHQKIERLQLKEQQPTWVQINNQPYTSNLFTKLLILVLNKHSLLDRFDYGIEMEADKPGWNDAMNGLPGLFGSGVSETIELIRIIEFLREANHNHDVNLPREVDELFSRLHNLPSYAERLSAREMYREAIRFGLHGTFHQRSATDINNYLSSLQEYLTSQLLELKDKHQGIIPTFLYTEIDPTDSSNVTLHVLPAFLEGPARFYKLPVATETLRSMHQSVLKTDLYDPVLQLFKTSVSLEEVTHEIGRIKAFTPGWLERESNFLHMTYKYLLGLLKAGLYEEYYQALETNFVCFMKPEVYGRSPLENSSFIVPSNNPDTRIHGQGFFARLSGSTVEALHMWFLMMTGGQPFTVNEEGVLTFTLQPKLHRDFFDSSGEVHFRLFHEIDVTIRNKKYASTYDVCNISTYELTHQEETTILHEPEISGEIAEQIRSGYYEKIVVIINE